MIGTVGVSLNPNPAVLTTEDTESTEVEWVIIRCEGYFCATSNIRKSLSCESVASCHPIEKSVSGLKLRIKGKPVHKLIPGLRSVFLRANRRAKRAHRIGVGRVTSLGVGVDFLGVSQGILERGGVPC